jgi:hypothetical protein
MRTLNVKQKLALFGIPGTLALGAVIYGSVTTFAAAPTTRTVPSAPAGNVTEAPSKETPAAAESATETAAPETSTEPTTESAADAAQPNGGFADTNASADTQQEGSY